MKRGDIVTIALQGNFGKPRPALVIQSDLFNPTHPTITILPLTSEVRDTPQFRITVEPSMANGLHKVSQVMVDKVMSYRRDKVGESIGRLDDDILVRINRALAVWLGIA
ncbi:MAG: type II toxin-antitoxin system PemK/MazF family toxin [Candidatus Competibacteraceae bacterium]